MLAVMRDLLKPMLDGVSTVNKLLHAALSIPLSEAVPFHGPETAVSDCRVSKDADGSVGASFKSVDYRPGYLMWSGFLASIWVQVRLAVVVGLPAEVESRASVGHVTNAGDHLTRHAIRSLDDYAGYQTRSGLGSMDIGGGRSHIDE
jgi:hypothetical protein